MKLQRSVSFLCAICLLLTTFGIHAQQKAPAAAPATTKRPLTHSDYDSWRSIQAPQISRDGKFVAYAYMPQDGDGEIVVRRTGAIAITFDHRVVDGARAAAFGLAVIDRLQTGAATSA